MSGCNEKVERHPTATAPSASGEALPSAGVEPLAQDLGARVGIIATMLLWGAQYPLTHDLAERWDAYTMLLVRYPPAAILLLALAARRGSRLAAVLGSAPTRRWLVLGAFLSGFGILFTLGLSIGDPAACAVAAAVAPLTAAIVAWLLEGKRPERALLVSLALVVPGAVLASVQTSPSASGARGPEGVALILAAQVCWSLYSLTAQRWLPGNSQVAITGSTLLWACPFIALAWLLAGQNGLVRAEWMIAPLRDAAMFGVLTFGSLVLGVVLWNSGVRHLGLAFCSLHLNLIPIVAIIVGLTLGQFPRMEQVMGAVLVIAGVVHAQRSSAHHRRPAR